MIAEASTGYPGYDSAIGPENATIGEILKENGYATSWFGKNHNTPTYQLSLAGPYDQWPSGMGFEYFYGFMGGETDQWTPYLFRDHTQVTPWVGHPGYNLTTDLADDAIKYMRELNAAAPDKPFFLYYVPGGTHAPHQPTPEWIKKISDMHLFDKGWNDLREQIFANQKRLGVIPANTQLTLWPDGQPAFGGASLPKWETLSADEKKLFIRQADVFAAYVAYTDNEIGRVIQEVKDEGKLDNTLIIYIAGDNGTSAEGSAVGTPFDMAAIEAITMPVADQLKYYDAWGSATTSPHMSVAWSWAFDTPFKWTKQPDKLRDMQELFLVEAEKNNVFPLDNDVLGRALAPRPSSTAGRTTFTYTNEVSGLPAASAPSTLGRSFSITAEVEIPPGGAEGMINTNGGRFGGYGLYLVRGKPVFTYVELTTERFRWESPNALPPGKHTIVFDFKYDGPGFGKGGTGVLSVDGKAVISKTMPYTIPFPISFDETFDVGVDTRTGVDDSDYQPPFRFTGKLDKLTINLVAPNSAEEKALQQKNQETKNKAQEVAGQLFGYTAYDDTANFAARLRGPSGQLAPLHW